MCTIAIKIGQAGIVAIVHKGKTRRKKNVQIVFVAVCVKCKVHAKTPTLTVDNEVNKTHTENAVHLQQTTKSTRHKHKTPTLTADNEVKQGAHKHLHLQQTTKLTRHTHKTPYTYIS